MKVLALTKYDAQGASSRLRTLQYVSGLQSEGIQIDVSPLFDAAYLAAIYSGQSRFLSGFTSYFRRIFRLFGFLRKNYDLIWIEKELFPWVPYPFEWLFLRLCRPYVVDYDDAIFHTYDMSSRGLVRFLLGQKINHVMAAGSLVIAGNAYLAARASAAGASRVEIIPTVIDLERYHGKGLRNTNVKPIIGWIGSPSTTVHLNDLRPMFQQLAAKHDFVLRLVGAAEFELEGVCVESLPWTEDTEVALVSSFDIGIMPLFESPFSKGKCGYKLIQYMACAVPVVASAIGANSEIIDDGIEGLLVSDNKGWLDALDCLLCSPAQRAEMGVAGRARVRARYCIQVTTPRLAALLQEVSAVKYHSIL